MKMGLQGQGRGLYTFNMEEDSCENCADKTFLAMGLQGQGRGLWCTFNHKEDLKEDSSGNKVKMVPTRLFDQPWAVAGSNLVAGVGEEPHLDEHDVGDADADDAGDDGLKDGHAVDDDDEVDDVDDDGSAHLEDSSTHQEVLQRHHRTIGLFPSQQWMIYLFLM